MLVYAGHNTWYPHSGVANTMVSFTDSRNGNQLSIMARVDLVNEVINSIDETKIPIDKKSIPDLFKEEKE